MFLVFHKTQILTASQKGAMFGLDARVALAILGALALIVGLSIFSTIPKVQARGLIKDIESYKAAIEGMQYDLRQGIGDVITTGGTQEIKRFQALNDRTMVQTSAQPRWLGPYVRSRSADASVHENYGQMYLVIAEHGDYTATGCSFCAYWLRIDDVPQETFTVVNQELDGDGELTPQTLGRAQWAAAAGPLPDRLYVRLGNSL